VVGAVTVDDGVARIVEASGGTVHGLANAADIMDDFTPIHEVSDAVWGRVFSVCITDVVKLTRAVVSPDAIECRQFGTRNRPRLTTTLPSRSK
jgi:NAD(P)-dependent dehydrogenase (short-subunit alcohol dehydrogenase family)